MPVSLYQLRGEVSLDDASYQSKVKSAISSGQSLTATITKTEQASSRLGKELGGPTSTATQNLSKHLGTASTQAKSLAKDLQTTEGQAHKTSSVFDKIKSSIFGIGGGVASVFGGQALFSGLEKAFDTVKGFVETGVEFEEVWEHAELRLTSFTGSAEEAERILTGVHKLAVDRALEFQPLAEATFRLAEMKFTGEETQKVLEGITARAVSIGRGSEGVQRLVGMLELATDTGAGAGRGLLALEKEGYRVGETMERMTGISRDIIIKNLKAGTVDPKAFIEVLTRGWTEQFGPVADKVSHTLTDEMTRAQEQAAPLIAQGISPMVKEMSRGMQGLEGVMEKWGPGFAQGINKAMGWAASALDQALTGILALADIKLKTQSPSKEFEDRGILAMQGLRDGFVKGAPEAKQGLLDALESILSDPRVKAFVDLIKRSEVGNDPNAAARLFGPLGHVDNPASYGALTGGWPGMRVQSPTLGRTVWTHPLGGAQIEPGTARSFSRATGTNLPMDEHTQDLIAVWLITQTRGALEKIQSGNIQGAMGSLGGTWESFKTYNRPGGPGAAGLVAQWNATIGGSPVSVSNPMPVQLARRNSADSFFTSTDLNNLADFTARNLAAMRENRTRPTIAGTDSPTLEGGSIQAASSVQTPELIVQGPVTIKDATPVVRPLIVPPMDLFKGALKEGSKALEGATNSTKKLQTAEQQAADAIAVFHKDTLRGTINKGLEGVKFDAQQGIRKAEVDAIVSIPGKIGDVAYNFLTKWDGTWKSAEDILLGGLEQIVVEGMANVVREMITKWIAQMLLNLFGIQVQGLSTDANTVSLDINSFSLDLNSASLDALTASLDAAIGSGFIDSLISGASAGAEGAQLGAPAFRGVPRFVGEAGPELFVPDTGGEIVPAHRLRAGVGGQSPTINYWQISTPDAGSFMNNATQSQITRKQALVARHAQMLAA